MKRRRKSSIPFPVALCAFVLASLYSASGQPSPTPLSNHSAAWDAARGQLVVFGGFNGPSPNDETWVWNGAWTRKNLANRPTARAYANMAYDEARQQVVLFGGSRDGILGLNDTWVWDGIDWSQWFPANQPSPRFLHGMAYDASRQEIVLFGGYDSGSYFDDTWVWNGTNWLSRSPVASPSPRGVAQGMAYDRLNREVVLFGGGDFVGGFANDTWTWNGTDWTARTPATAPPNRYGHALAYDGVRITLFGGSALNDTWVWDGTFWSQQFPQQTPPSRSGHTLTFVPTKESLLLFGGMDRPFGVTFGDTWLWDGTTWRERPDFSDDFEAPTLNSFWTVTAQSGSVRLSTNLALSGSRSAQFSSTQNTGQKNIRLSHVFSRGIFGRVSVWLYDIGADQPSGNEVGLLLENRALGQSARLFVLDHDLGQTEGGTHFYQVFGQTEASRTSIDRTKAWHQYTVISTEASLTLEIDGQVVYAGPGGVPFDAVHLYMSGPTWQPPAVTYFDDFAVQELSGGQTRGFIYWSTAGESSLGGSDSKIRRARLDGTSIETILTNATSSPFTGLAVDAANGFIHGGNGNTLFRANLDGGGRTNLFTNTPVFDVELDLAGGKLYWSGTNSIDRANLDGSGRETILTNIGFCQGLALDTGFERIYFSDSRNIRVADFTGTGPSDFLVLSQGAQPFDVEIDPVNRRLYWNEYWSDNVQDQRIRSVNLDGPLDIQTVLQPAKVIGNGLCFDESGRKLYFASTQTNGNAQPVELNRINPDGTAFELLAGDQGRFNYFAVVPDVGFPDLSLSTTVSPSAPVAGGAVTYTITVANRGLGLATGATLFDTLPAGVSFVSATSSQGNCAHSGNIVTCNVGFLTNGATVTVTITVTPLAAGTFINVAGVFCATTDSNPADNTATTETVVSGPAAPASFAFVTIPGLPTDVALGHVWGRTENEAYVWGSRITPGTIDVPESILFRWNGADWNQILEFPGNRPDGVFGVGVSDVFISMRDAVLNRSRIFRSTDAGKSFTEQNLPFEAISNEVRGFAGTMDNVHAIVDGGRIIRFDGANWVTIYEDILENVYAHTIPSPKEGYYVTCWGWGSWDGNAWGFYGRQFDFCEVSGTWAIRDPIGQLHRYAVGNNHFADGVRVWKFDESTQSFGGRANTVFAEGNGIDIGSATGVWGSAADDVYVVGELAEAPGAARMGRIYHFDGSAWSRLTGFGEIAPPGGVHGTSGDDVWVSLTDGRMLRLRKSGLTNDPPQITTHPASATGIVGSTVNFAVTARGTPPLQYRWQLNFTNIVGATNPVLTLRGLRPEDAGSYRAAVTNLFGSATSVVATLTVVDIPVISSQPQSTNVTLGANVSFSVAASGVGLRYQWRKNGANIGGATNATLVLNTITVTDGGSYTVVVANDAGAVTSDIAELRISVPGSPPSRDNFVDREPISLINGVPTVFSGTSSNATKEPNEPDHAGRTGGRSVWYTWQAPASGTVEFNTYGSTFDTLLAVYTGTSLASLVEVASNDDEESNEPGASTNRFFASVVHFNAESGTAYQIALDGFNGAEGSYLLSGVFIQTPDLLPQITVQPANQVVPFGGFATFSVSATGSTLGYAWYFNGNPIPGATSDTLTIFNAGVAQVGSYSVRVTDFGSGRSVDSRRAVLEISGDPSAGVTFQDKLEFGTSAAASATFIRSDGRPIQKAGPEDVPFYSVSAGTIGYHLGNNVFGTTDLQETNHCNLIGRGTMYLRFETTSAGTLVIDTAGSLIDNLVAVYRDVTSYDALRTNLLGCATNNVHVLVTSSVGIPNRVQIPGLNAGQRFLVVADGNEGESGVLQVNWLMGNPPEPTSIPPPPVARVNEGEATSLLAGDHAITDALPAPSYQWYRDGILVPDATNPWLDLTDLHSRDAGLYYVVITTPFGIVTNYVATVEVRIPFTLVGLPDRLTGGIFDLQVSGTPGEPFALQSTPDLFRWTDVVVGALPGYTVMFSDTNAGASSVRFYRITAAPPP